MNMMRRTVYTLCLLFALFLQAEASTPMRTWLGLMPDSVMPLLTKNNLLDFIDFYDYQMEAVVTNRLEGKSRMEMLTDDYVLINYTRMTDVAMKLLPVNDTTDILCMVTTMKAESGRVQATTASSSDTNAHNKSLVGDSRIAFFDAQWQPLEVKNYLSEPCMANFRSSMQGDSATWAWSKMDIFFKTYRLSAEDSDLRCVLTATDFLSKEDREEVAPYVRKEPLTYHWTNGRYTLE